jgi:hypothetical protein
MAIFDDDITGTGVTDVGDNKVKYILWRIDTVGWEARLLAVRDSDRYARIGFIALGYYGDVGDGTERHYWQPPIWIDWLNGEWIPPQTYASDGFQYMKSVRWSLSDGVTGHLWIAN